MFELLIFNCVGIGLLVDNLWFDWEVVFDDLNLLILIFEIFDDLFLILREELFLLGLSVFGFIEYFLFCFVVLLLVMVLFFKEGFKFCV